MNESQSESKLSLFCKTPKINGKTPCYARYDACDDSNCNTLNRSPNSSPNFADVSDYRYRSIQ